MRGYAAGRGVDCDVFDEGYVVNGVSLKRIGCEEQRLEFVQENIGKLAVLFCGANIPKQVDWNSKAALATAVAMDRIVIIMAQFEIGEDERNVVNRD